MNPDVRAHTLGVLAILEGITVNDVPVPLHQVGVSDDTSIPYVIVTPSAGGVLDGTLDDPNADADLVFLVTCAVLRREGARGAQQALWLQQEVRDRLLAGVDVEGWTVMRVRLDVPGGVTEDTDSAPHRFFTVDRFVLATTPATPVTT